MRDQTKVYRSERYRGPDYRNNKIGGQKCGYFNHLALKC